MLNNVVFQDQTPQIKTTKKSVFFSPCCVWASPCCFTSVQLEKKVRKYHTCKPRLRNWVVRMPGIISVADMLFRTCLSKFSVKHWDVKTSGKTVIQKRTTATEPSSPLQQHLAFGQIQGLGPLC